MKKREKSEECKKLNVMGNKEEEKWKKNENKKKQWTKGGGWEL